VGKTGGGRGTNQYRVRGRAKAADDKRPQEACGYPADQVVKRGDCVWLRTGFDGTWCLKHRQLAPELRQLMGLVPCVAQADPLARLRAAQRLPLDQLDWATKDAHPLVRQVAAERWSEDQLQWATTDEDPRVRRVAAQRMPTDELQWAMSDWDWRVCMTAAQRLSVDQLGPTATDA